MGDAETLNDLFSKLAADYGYEGLLNKFQYGHRVIHTDIVENMVRLFECRFDAEMKLIKKRLGINK